MIWVISYTVLATAILSDYLHQRQYQKVLKSHKQAIEAVAKVARHNYYRRTIEVTKED